MPLIWNRLWCSAALYKLAWCIAWGLLIGAFIGSVFGCAKSTYRPPLVVRQIQHSSVICTDGLCYEQRLRLQLWRDYCSHNMQCRSCPPLCASTEVSK